MKSFFKIIWKIAGKIKNNRGFLPIHTTQQPVNVADSSQQGISPVGGLKIDKFGPDVVGLHDAGNSQPVEHLPKGWFRIPLRGFRGFIHDGNSISNAGGRQ